MGFRIRRSIAASPANAAAPRYVGWLLAMSLVLPSLIGWLPMPMRAYAGAPPANAAAESAETATARLLADLAVLCTPDGLRLAGQKNAPAKPSPNSGNGSCVLCGLAAGASVGVFPVQPDAHAPPPAQMGRIPESAAGGQHSTIAERPPGRGPPN